MWFNAILIMILVICLITDIKERKIYNKVIFPGLLIAVAGSAVMNGWEGVTQSMLGFLTGLGILLIPYLLGGMGAGDVKLLALIGAFKGTMFVLNTALFMALVGGLIALGILLFRKGLIKRLIYAFATRRYGLKISLIDKESMKATYPYGVAIVAGAFISFIAKGGWLL